jgi:DNA cross-link repair 1C protein
MEPFMDSHHASQSENDTQTTSSSLEIPLRERGDEDNPQLGSSSSPSAHSTLRGPASPSQADIDAPPRQHSQDGEAPTSSKKRDFDEYWLVAGFEDDSQASEVSERALQVRMTAFQAMLANVKSGDWQRIGLLSTDDNHTAEEEELGLDVG